PAALHVAPVVALFTLGHVADAVAAGLVRATVRTTPVGRDVVPVIARFAILFDAVAATGAPLTPGETLAHGVEGAVVTLFAGIEGPVATGGARTRIPPGVDKASIERDVPVVAAVHGRVVRGHVGLGTRHEAQHQNNGT